MLGSELAGVSVDRLAAAMYIYIMERTQIYLSKVEAKILAQLSRRTGRTRSQLIREAIEATYVEQRSPESIEASLVETAGAWRRSSRATGSAWVERRRRGRLSRLHGGE